jgi:hypothetical protein
MTDTTTTAPERDPEPFGPPGEKPSTSTPCRVTSVHLHARTPGPPGFETMLTICVETPDRNFDLSIDERSASFLAHAILLYVKPFQSFNRTGTPSFEAANPSA